MTFALYPIFSKTQLSTDFFIYWRAGRSFILEHQNPYSHEVTLQIQQGIYGRPALPTQDQVNFAYPPYALLAVLPFCLLPFPMAAASWFALNFVALLAVILLTFPKSPKWVLLTFLLFYPLTFSLFMGNFVTLVGTILILSLGILVFRQPSHLAQIFIGILLAWSSVKTQFIGFFLIFFLIYAVKNKLWRFMISFAASAVFFVGLSFIFLPHWLVDWLKILSEYVSYLNRLQVVNNLLAAFLPANPARLLATIFTILAIVLTAWLLAAWWHGMFKINLLLGWIGLVTYFVHPPCVSYEQIIFLIPLLFWFALEKSTTLQKILGWVIPILLSWGFSSSANGFIPVQTSGV